MRGITDALYNNISVKWPCEETGLEVLQEQGYNLWTMSSLTKCALNICFSNSQNYRINPAWPDLVMNPWKKIVKILKTRLHTGIGKSRLNQLKGQLSERKNDVFLYFSLPYYLDK